MNKKGQTLIAFVIILPAMLLVMAFVVDTGLLLKESTKLKSVTKTILKTTYQEKKPEKIANLYEKNGIPIEHLEVEIQENKMIIANEYKKESIFGKIIGIKEYTLKNKMSATLADGKIEINKE